MLYSDDDVRDLCKDIDRIIINGDKYNDKVTSLEDLQNRLRRKAKFKEIDFQSKCEGDNSLGDLLLKHATENDNSRVKDFLLEKGFNSPQQEQVATAANEEEEQKTPDIEENKADGDRVDSSNSGDTQFAMSYNKIKEIVINNPGITAGKFNEELKKEKIDTKITNQDGWTLLYYAVRSEGPSIIDGRSIFLKIVELFTNLNIGIDFKDTASRTVLGTAAINKQADVVRILLNSGKFNEEEKFNALRLAITQDNSQEAELILGYVSPANRKEALEVAIQVDKTEIVNAFLNSGKLNEENRAKSCSSNGDNHNNEGEMPVVTASTILTKKTNPTTVPNSGNGGSKPVSPVVSTNAGTPAMSSGNDKSSNIRTHGDGLSNQTVTQNSGNGQHHNNEGETPVIPETKQTATLNKVNGFVDAQFSMPNEKETKYKENFHNSLKRDVVGVVVTGLLIAAAIMVPSVAGAVVCGVIAALVAIYTGLHVKNSTLPSYREMEENKVEHVSSGIQKG